MHALPRTQQATVEAALQPTFDVAGLHDTLVGRGYIHYHGGLAERLESFKAAMMMGQALYWTRYWLKREPHRGGWFYMTVAQWREATGLTATEQETARRLMRDKGIWSEEWLGSPARWHFRVDLERLAVFLRDDGDADPQGLARLLGSPLLYFKPLGDMTGSVAAGLLLSHMLASMRRAYLKREVTQDGYFWVENPRAELGLSEKVQRNARSVLASSGFVQRRWSDERTPRQLLRLNLPAVMACLQGQPLPDRQVKAAERAAQVGHIEVAPLQSSLLVSPAEVPTRLIPATSSGLTVVRRLVAPNEAAQARPASSAILVAPGASQVVRVQPQRLVEAADLTDPRYALSPTLNSKVGPFTDPRYALSPRLYTQPSFTKNSIPTPPTSPQSDGPGELDQPRSRRVEESLEGKSGSQTPGEPETSKPDSSSTSSLAEPEPAIDLVLPARLDNALRKGALELVGRAPATIRQRLLDELAGNLDMPNKISRPLAWLFAVVEKACAGTLIFTEADAVAARREAQRQQELRATATAGVAVDDPRGDEPGPASDPAKVAAIRAKLAQQRAFFVDKSYGAGKP